MADQGFNVEQPSGLKEAGLSSDIEQNGVYPSNWLTNVWKRFRTADMADKAQRFGTAFLLIILILLIVFVMGRYYLPEQIVAIESAQTPTVSRSTEAESSLVDVEMPPLAEPYSYGAYDNGLARLARLHTDLPSRPRWEVTTYIVQTGDNIFDIAGKFNLNPSTVMWANYDTLADNPAALTPGQELFILPVDGTYYEWHAGDGLNTVAEFFKASPDDIVNWPGNNLSAETIGDYANPNIEPGTWLVIPNGYREFISWSAPLITRETAAEASIFGPGACGAIYDGPVGDGVMIWPTIERWLSGYDYSAETNHYGIDIAGDIGYAIWAVDDGVVVYSGWNNWGYGNVIVIDHGNGWQSLYAHLEYVNYGCGDYVYEGDIIGGMGSTGKSTGPHLHLELRSDLYGRPNPYLFLN